MRYFILLSFCGLILAAALIPCLAYGQGGVGMGEFQDQLLQIKRTQLGPALGVDQSTVDRLISIDQKYSPLRTQYIKDAKTAYFRLQQVMQSPNPPEAEVRSLLNEMLQKEREITALKQKQSEEEMAVLSPIQQARYILYLVNLRQEITKEARALKGSPGGPGPKGPKGGPLREVPVVRPTP